MRRKTNPTIQVRKPITRRPKNTLKEHPAMGIANEVFEFFREDCFPSLTVRELGVAFVSDEIERHYKSSTKDADFCEAAIDSALSFLNSCDVSVHDVVSISMPVLRDDLRNLFIQYYHTRRDAELSLIL